MARLYRISALILLAAWTRSLFAFAYQAFGTRATERILDHIRKRGLDQLHGVALSFFTHARSGELIDALTTQVYNLRYLFSTLFFVTGRLWMLLAYMVCMLALSWQLTLLAMGMFAVVFFSLTWIVRAARRGGEATAAANAHFAATAVEMIQGVRTFSAFSAQAYERKKVFRASEAVARHTIETTTRSALSLPLAECLATSMLVVIVLLATQMFIMQGRMPITSLLTFLFVLFRMMPMIQQINSSRAQVATAQGSLDSISRLLSREGKPYVADGAAPLNSFETAIVFENVGFAYEPGRPVLHEVSLRVEKGRTTALVGASGAGKSTLADLIVRFYDPTEGKITIDGHDLRALRIETLRARIAIVSQDTFIFNDTVRANIAYGIERPDEDRLRRAAEAAGALEFIEDLPRGFDEELGERGVRLSGGQRQRIAMARAFYRDAEILILDEATSALDTVSERQIQSAMERLMEGRTVVVIAHRLSTVENADLVVVLEGGRVVEQGTYPDLSARQGHLWKYHAMQYQLS